MVHQQEDLDYTRQEEESDPRHVREADGNRPSPRKKGPHWPQVLSALLIAVCLVSIIALSQTNHNLQDRLDRAISAEEGEEEPPEEGAPADDLYASSVRRDRGEPLTIPEIAEIGKPSVVAISTEKAIPFGYYFEATMPVAGSGFFITEDGYIATNNHVVENARNVKVHTDDGNFYEAEVVGTDPASDLAVIKVEAHEDQSFPAVTFGDSDQLQVGELAVAIGNPAGTLEGSVTAGIISAKERIIDVDNLELNVLQTDASINAGNSGGALFNSYGEVIGINTAKLSGSGSASFDGIAFAIPSNFARNILNDLKEYGEVRSRVMIGISGRGFDADFARLYNLADRPGIMVAEVLPDSSADKAGIQEGDFIVEMDGRATDSIATVNNIKNSWQVGDSIEVVYFRGGEKQTTEMVLQGKEAEENRETDPTEPPETA